jgi:hypothetical protein
MSHSISTYVWFQTPTQGISVNTADSEGESSEDEESLAFEDGNYGTETWAEYRQEGARCTSPASHCQYTHTSAAATMVMPCCSMRTHLHRVSSLGSMQALAYTMAHC